MGDVVSFDKFKDNTTLPRREFEEAIGILHDGHFETFKAQEIAQDGICFLADFKAELGKRVVVNFHIPHIDLIITQGRISQSKVFSGGLTYYFVTFTGLSFSDKRHLRKFVAEKIISQKKKDITLRR